MLASDVVEFFGSGNKRKTAREFNVHPSAVSKWFRGDGHVPVNVALLAETKSKGSLVFDKKYYQSELLALHEDKK